MFKARSIWAIVLATVLFFWLMPKATDLGFRWQRPYDPPIPTTVTLKDGRTYAGLLSPADNGLEGYQLTTSGGQVVVFKDFQKMVSDPLATVDRGTADSWRPWVRWRAFLPAAILLAVYMWWLAGPVWPRQQGRNRDAPSGCRSA